MVDGGSTDDTVAVSRNYNAAVLFSEKGKGIQLNQGADYADGDILLFLHADTFLPENAFDFLDVHFADEVNKLTTFRLAFDLDHTLMRAYESFSKYDSILTTFGDQCIVIRKSFFEKLGRFPEIPIMEDIALLRKARKFTTIIKQPVPVLTSSRRFVKNGLITTQLLNAWYIFLYLIGINPSYIHSKYFNGTH